MVDFSIADKIYLGDIEVSKVYKNGELLYQKQSSGGGGNIYIDNSNLVLSEGLIISLTDYSSSEQSKIQYTLPENITVSSPDPIYSTLSDGTSFSYYADMEGSTYEYQDGIKSIITSSGGIINTTGDVNYLRITGSSYTAANGYGYNITADVFAFDCTKDCESFTLNLTGFYGGTTLPTKIGVAGAYLHDHGEGSIANVSGLFYYYPSGMKDPNDVALGMTKNGTAVQFYLTQDNLLKAGHCYSVYIIGKESVFISAQTYSLGGGTGSTYANVTLRHNAYYYNYDKTMHVNAQGYSYNGDKSLQISVTTYEPMVEWGEISLGTVKYNPTQGYYDAVPVN